MTSTRAARAAGSIEATTAAASSTMAETITGHGSRHLQVAEVAAGHARGGESERRASDHAPPWPSPRLP